MTSRKGPGRQSVAEMQRQTELQARRGHGVGRNVLKNRAFREGLKRDQQRRREATESALALTSIVLNAAARAELANAIEAEYQARQETTREKLIKAGVITRPVRDAREVSGLGPRALSTIPVRVHPLLMLDETDNYPGVSPEEFEALESARMIRRHSATGPARF